jgi:hypothetical protein
MTFGNGIVIGMLLGAIEVMLIGEYVLWWAKRKRVKELPKPRFYRYTTNDGEVITIHPSDITTGY